jgi:hypothetical protein
MRVGLMAGLAIGGALTFTILGPTARAGAVGSVLAALASITAALTALHLSSEALDRTDRQLALARDVTVLARYPLLLPVHQSVAFPESTGVLAAHPPARDRFRLTPPTPGTYAFLEDTNGRFVIPVENAGEGPALDVRGTLWRDDGCSGAIVGPTALRAGNLMVMTAALGQQASLPDWTTAALNRFLGADREDSGFYCLELIYTDVFANELRARAVFDSRGSGGWRHVKPSAVNPRVPVREIPLVRRR